MSGRESVVVCVAILAGTVAAILGSLTPELSGLIGFALGYGGKGVANVWPARSKDEWRPGP